MILGVIRKTILWGLALWMLVYFVAGVLLPASLAYDYFGWRWAVVVGIATVGVVWFIYRFGPWLIGRWIAKAIAKDVHESMERLAEDIDAGHFDTPYLDARRNHTLAEGIDVWYYRRDEDGSS